MGSPKSTSTTNEQEEPIDRTYRSERGLRYYSIHALIIQVVRRDRHYSYKGITSLLNRVPTVRYSESQGAYNRKIYEKKIERTTFARNVEGRVCVVRYVGE